MMLNAFPQSQSTKLETDLKIETFRLACDGLTDDAVMATCMAYIQGRVDGHNRSFAPSCAEFAATARTMPVAATDALAIAAPVERKVRPEYAASMSKWIENWASVMPDEAAHRRFRKENPLKYPMYQDELR
jgi:hypothetical protein